MRNTNKFTRKPYIYGILFILALCALLIIIAWLAIWISIPVGIAHYILAPFSPYGEWIGAIVGFACALYFGWKILNQFRDWLDKEEEVWDP
jgi:hypothetical protein